VDKRRRLEALQKVQRLRRHELELTGAAMAELRQQEAWLEGELAELKEKALREARESSAETRTFLAPYLDAVSRTEGHIEARKAQLREELERVKEELYGRFLNEKVADQTAGRARTDIALDRRRAELLEMDEAARLTFIAARRRPAPGQG